MVTTSADKRVMSMWCAKLEPAIPTIALVRPIADQIERCSDEL
jgi:hypothetical protein